MSKKRGPWGDDNDQQRQRMGVVPTRFLSWTFEIKVAECQGYKSVKRMKQDNPVRKKVCRG